MPPLNITPGVTRFSDITQHANALDKNSEIRGRTKHGVTQLYQHGAKLHGDNFLSRAVSSSADIQAKQAARQQKVQQGADWIKGAIDTQYTQAFRARVFVHVKQQDRNTDLDHRITKHDLGTIQNSIQYLQAKDGQATQQIQANTPTPSKPFDQSNAAVLMSIANDPDVSPALRDQAANLFQTSMMNLTAQQRDTILTQRPNLIDALVTLRLSNGNRVFDVNNLSTLARNQFQYETPHQKDATFFRGNSTATRLLSSAIVDLDGGRMKTLADNIRNEIRQQIGVASYTGTPLMAQHGTGVLATDIANSAVVNPILTAIDALLGGQPQTNELHQFLSAVEIGINAGPPPPRAQGAAELLKNAIWLRGLGGMIQSNFAQPNSSEQKVASAVTGALQKALTGHPYPQVGAGNNFVSYNTALAMLLTPGSGFDQFQGTIP
jgi:hypothetical protein